MIRIIGIDPGSRVTGYGVIELDAGRTVYVASGCIRTRGDELAPRLGTIFSELGSVIDEFSPGQLAIERVFMNKNADSALKLGQARGAAICAGVHRAMPVAEYAAREIKQAVTGSGGASKEQVQHMICVLLSLREQPPHDAADALAVAICHHHVSATAQRMTVQRPQRGRALR